MIQRWNHSRGMKAILALSTLAAGLGFGQKNPKDAFQFPALNKIQTPSIVETTLKNGMKLLLVEDRQYPTIDMRAMIHTGSVYDPAEKAGLASLTGTVMRTGGSAKFPGDALDKLLETLGAEVETGMDQTSGSVTVSLLQEDVDKGLEVLADVLANPLFPQEKIDLAKIELKSAISRRNDDVGQIADREFNALIYGRTSGYARQAEYATVDAITRDDLVAFHKRFYHPNNVILAVWGNFKAKDMEKKIAAAFAALKPEPLDVPKPPAVDYKYDFSVNFVDKPDVNQSNIQLGHIGTTMDNPDYPALVVMNQILSFDRMFKRIRTDEGLAYSVWGYYGADYDHPGSFSAGCQTKSQSTVKAVRLMLEEIRKIQNSEVTDKELQKSKDSYLNGFVFNFDSKGKIVSRQMNYAFYGFPKDFAEMTKAGVEKVTKADVMRVAQKYLKPDQVRILVVGKKEDFDEPLANLGAVNAIDIAIPQPKEAVPEASPEAAKKGGVLLAEALTALGGREALTAVKAVKISMQMSQGGMSFAGTATVVYPDKMNMVMNTPYGEVTMIILKDAAWMNVPQQPTMPLPETQAQGIRRSMLRDPSSLAGNMDALKVQYVGPKDLNGKTVEDLLVVRGDYAFHLLIDPATKLPAGAVYSEVGPQGPMEMTEAASDYKTFGALRFAMKNVTTAGGQKLSESTITDIQLNPVVDAAIFEKK
jgi:zinc protease